MPKVKPHPVGESAQAIAARSLPCGEETVLIVEDDSSLRTLASVVLERQGYQVLVAANGHEGLNAARQHRGPPIQLVVTDIVMPQLDGKGMADWLRAVSPELKILFTSGYPAEVIAQHGVLEPNVPFLPKPYTPATLVCKVRELLDA